ncbi:GNAT family N-acetyltransferase [Pontiellaceae bacterium B12219]|nr:GNAT family N-acetyltransferase [Pontiellaceae bacterium B12219]
MKPANGAAIYIRRVGLNRIDDLLALEESSFPTDRINRRNLRNLLRSESACCMGAYADGNLIGSLILLFRAGTRSARIYSLAVAEAVRGRGVGRKLMVRAEREARKRGSIKMNLEVRADNIPAMRLYEKLGFEKTAILPGYYEDGSPANKYRKEIGHYHE